MTFFDKIITAIRRENLGGWLFYNHNHHDPIADKLLDIPETASNSRPWIYLIKADSAAVKIVHQIEEQILDHLPGDKIVYSGRTAMAGIAGQYVAENKSIALNFSVEYPKLSFVDHGTFLWLTDLGFKLVSSDTCIQQSLSTLTVSDLESHEAAALCLYQIVEEVWQKISHRLSVNNRELYEGEVLSWVMDLFEKNGLETELPLIIGTGKNTTFPHYSPERKGAQLLPGQVVQIDIWGKKKTEHAIYADISWIGYLGSSVPEKEQDVFTAIIEARDAAVTLLTKRFRGNEPVTGAEVDALVDASLRNAGYGEYIKHRTGHSIDTDVHGTGVNIDSREFPDHRFLSDGACFSIEPGLYLEDFGMRTEIDVYIRNNTPKISGKTPQNKILCLE